MEEKRSSSSNNGNLNSKYNDVSYWDDRYETEEQFDWLQQSEFVETIFEFFFLYVTSHMTDHRMSFIFLNWFLKHAGYDATLDLLSDEISRRDSEILILGCGNSNLTGYGRPQKKSPSTFSKLRVFCLGTSAAAASAA